MGGGAGRRSSEVRCAASFNTNGTAPAGIPLAHVGVTGAPLDVDHQFYLSSELPMPRFALRLTAFRYSPHSVAWRRG